MFAIMIIFVLGISLVYKFHVASDNRFSYDISEEYRGYLEKNLESLNVNHESDKSAYVSVKTQLDLSDLYKKYGVDDWHATIINDKMESLLYQLNEAKYGMTKNELTLIELEKEYNRYIKRLDENDWLAFAREELEIAKKQKKELEQTKEQTVDKEMIKDLERQIYQMDVDIEGLNYRINEGISYNQGYLNSALERYVGAKKELYQTDKKELGYNEQLSYEQTVAEMEKAKYVIDTKENIGDTNTARYWILDVYNQYGMFIFITIIIITAMIVSEEFSKGTIKLLLIKPYERYKILLAKLITVSIILILSMVFLMLVTTIITGCVFSFESLSIPAVEYNFHTKSIEKINVIPYMLIETCYQLPNYFFILVLTFAISTIITNSGIAIAMSLVFQMFYQIINMLAIQYNIKFLKYFITLNLDFTQYKFGAKPQFEHINFTHSIVVYLVYILAILIPTFIVFKKKNIKNI